MGLLSPTDALAPEAPSLALLGSLPSAALLHSTEVTSLTTPFRTQDTTAQADTTTPPAPVPNWSRRARRPSHRVFPPSLLSVDSFLPFFLSYGYYCVRQRYYYIPGFLRHRVLAPVPEYNQVDPNSYTRRLQDIYFHTTSFCPPPCRDLRVARPVVSLPRHGPRQCLDNFCFSALPVKAPFNFPVPAHV